MNSNEEKGQRFAQIGTYGGLSVLLRNNFQQNKLTLHLIFYSNVILKNKTVKWSRTLLLSPFCFLPYMEYLNIIQILTDESELRIRRVY